VHILKKEEKFPKLDYKAGRQIFDREHDQREPLTFATVPRDTVNPIDIKLRQLAMEGNTLDLKKVFYDLNIVIIHQEGLKLSFIKGKIKDLFMATRDVYVKTRQGKVYVVPFDKSFELSEREF